MNLINNQLQLQDKMYNNKDILVTNKLISNNKNLL